MCDWIDYSYDESPDLLVFNAGTKKAACVGKANSELLFYQRDCGTGMLSIYRHRTKGPRRAVHALTGKEIVLSEAEANDAYWEAKVKAKFTSNRRPLPTEPESISWLTKAVFIDYDFV